MERVFVDCIIRAYYDNLIKSVDLSEYESITVGSDSDDTISFPAVHLNKAQIAIRKKADKFEIRGRHLKNSENSRVFSDTIEVGKRYFIDCKPMITLSIHPKQADAKTMLGIENIREITIGRGRTNDVMLTNKITSTNHCKITKKDGLYKIKDTDSRNGTFVNGKRIRERILNDGDIINISIYQILFANHALTFYNIGDDLDINETINENIFDEQHIASVKANVGKSGTKSMFEIENEYNVKSKKKGTFSMFDLNVNINIDNKN